MDSPWPHTGCLVVLDRDVTALVDALVADGSSVRHRFEPFGESLVRLGASGSVAVHTWPERGVATVDGYGAISVDLVGRLIALGWVVLEVTHARPSS